MGEPDAKAAADAIAKKAERRDRARRKLLGGNVDSPQASPRNDPVVRSTVTAFEEFCKAAVELGAQPQDMIDIWKAELVSLSTDAERHTHRLGLLERNMRGCRVRIVRCTDLLNGCEGLVLSMKRAVGTEKRLAVRCTMPDGAVQEFALRPDFLTMIQSRQDAEEEEAERLSYAHEEALVEAARRMTTSQPLVLQAQLNDELKSKSFAELRAMAGQIDEGGMLLFNPLVKHDKACFREALAELLVRSDDGGAILSELVEGATHAEQMEAIIGAPLGPLAEGDDEDDEEEVEDGGAVIGPSGPPARGPTGVEEMGPVVEIGPAMEIGQATGAVMGSAMGPAAGPEIGPAPGPAMGPSPPGPPMALTGILALDAMMIGAELPGSAPREDPDDEGGMVYGPAAYGPPTQRTPTAAPSAAPPAPTVGATDSEDDASSLKAVLASAFGMASPEDLKQQPELCEQRHKESPKEQPKKPKAEVFDCDEGQPDKVLKADKSTDKAEDKSRVEELDDAEEPPKAEEEPPKAEEEPPKAEEEPPKAEEEPPKAEEEPPKAEAQPMDEEKSEALPKEEKTEAQPMDEEKSEALPKEEETIEQVD